MTARNAANAISVTYATRYVEGGRTSSATHCSRGPARRPCVQPRNAIAKRGRRGARPTGAAHAAAAIGCAKSESRDNGNATDRERGEGIERLEFGPRMIISRAEFFSRSSAHAPRARAKAEINIDELVASSARVHRPPPSSLRGWGSSLTVPSLLPLCPSAARGNFWVAKSQKESEKTSHVP